MRTLNQERKGRVVNAARPDAAVEPAPVESMTIQVELITPLFGGGVIAGEVDGKHWLRASEIKAGMRFWWRVLYGRAAATPGDMWERESQLFGGPAKYEKGTVRQHGGRGVFALEAEACEVVRPGLSAKEFAKPNSPESVAYFAAAMTQSKVLLKNEGQKGTLILRWKATASQEERDQVLKSLAAFLAFGGVGARTRKGAGALAPASLEDAIQLKHYPVRGEKDLERLKPEAEIGTTKRNSAHFFGGHGPMDLMVAAGGHRTLLNAWKEVRKAARSLILRDSPFEPRLPLGLPLTTKQGAKSTKATDRLASPVWGGVARIWPDGNDKEPSSQRVEPTLAALVLIGDPTPAGKVPVTNSEDLKKIRSCIQQTLKSQSFKSVWSVPGHE